MTAGAEPPLYVLSTGRAGSTMISRLLTSAGAGGAVAHQLPGSRAINVAGNLALAGRMPLDAAERLARRLGFDPAASTADPLRSMLLAALVRAGRVPAGARVVHVVRDPRTFVSSFMSWKDGSVKRRVLHHLVPAWQPNPWLTGEAGALPWVRMSKFEHFCWVWSYKNRLFESLADRCGYHRVRLEDLAAGGGAEGLLRFAGVAPGAAPPQPLGERVNSSTGRFPGWQRWTAAQAGALRAHCGALMRQYGYGEEPEWLRLAEAR